MAQLDSLADILAGDLAKAAAPADRAVASDLALLAVEKDFFERDVPRDRPEVVAAGEEVIERLLAGRAVDAAVVLAGQPGGVSLAQLAERERCIRQLGADLGAPGLVEALDRPLRGGVAGARVQQADPQF